MIVLAAESLNAWDWAVIGGFISLAVFLGVWFTRRAGRSTEEFFLSGRKLPWWQARASSPPPSPQTPRWRWLASSGKWAYGAIGSGGALH